MTEFQNGIWSSRKQALLFSALMALVLLFPIVPLRVEASEGSVVRSDWNVMMQSIERAETAGTSGDWDLAAEESARSFQQFEESTFHKALLSRDKDLYRALEGHWLHLIHSFENQDAGGAHRAGVHLREAMDQAIGLVDAKASPLGVAVNAFVILFREGIEALLILGAILAMLRKIGRRDLSKVLYMGAGFGVLASFALFYVSLRIPVLQGRGAEIVEGVTMLIAACVLFYLSYWLISKIDGQRWQRYIKENVERALSKGRVRVLAWISFLVVFREGMETVLMVRALGMSASGWSMIAAGLLVATLVLGLVYVAMMVFGMRLPLSQFFAFTSAFLLVLVFKFVGDGILELQEGALLSFHPVSWFPTSRLLGNVLGIHATAEGLLGQAVVLVAIGIGLWITLRKTSADLANEKPTKADAVSAGPEATSLRFAQHEG